MNDDLIKHFFGGFVRLHILYHAAEEPTCGVDMMEELGRHGYELGPGTLYPILHQMEQKGYLTCATQVVAGRQRKNYRITARGRRVLSDARGKLAELAREIIDEGSSTTKTKLPQKRKSSTSSS